jgi:hypothetical protein
MPLENSNFIWPNQYVTLGRLISGGSSFYAGDGLTLVMEKTAKRTKIIQDALARDHVLGELGEVIGNQLQSLLSAICIFGACKEDQGFDFKTVFFYDFV